jgi:hypothetical protein
MPEGKEPKTWSVQISNYLKSLLQEKLVTRKYEERQSWYSLSEEGKAYLNKARATEEISQSSYAHFDCQIVPSTDNKAWASVYSGPINPFTGRTIVDQMKAAKINTIILHDGTPPKQEQPRKKN